MTCLHRFRAVCLLGALLAFSLRPQPVVAYSALTHEAIVDAVWEDSIKPLLIKKYAGVTEAELREAHAYAYGGCILQDLGYYPFGSRFFTDLLHYVRSGDFATTIIRDAEPIGEYAFALGVLEHYLADQTGHRNATNVVVPIEFPQLRRKYDSWVTYEDDPDAHLKIEFGFDVLQVAVGRYTPTLDHDFIGFEVARDLLDRTFYRVYGLKVSDVLVNEDLAMGTYRHTVSELIPEATKIAWEMKKDELRQLLPGIQRSQFVFDLTKNDYEKEWGNQYESPSWFDTVLAFVFRLTPRVGPLKALAVKPLTPDTERLFIRSFDMSVDRYRAALQQLHRAIPPLGNVNLDTGQAVQGGTYRLADETYADLVERLHNHDFADVTPELRENLLAFYQDPNAPIATKEHRREWWQLQNALAALRAESPPSASAAHLPATGTALR